jgi:NADH-ubiquinone oxidoreductase chain 5
MVIAIGLHQYSLSLFHLFNHAFFKALLFLSAGSLIHSLCEEQEFRKAGSIIWTNPLTSILILIGSLSLIGAPFLSGFYSKELIIEMSVSSYKGPFRLAILGYISVIFTSLYSFNILLSSLWKDEKGSLIARRLRVESPTELLLLLYVLALMSVISGYYMVNFTKYETTPLVSSSLKLIPLCLSLIGAFLSILGIVIFKYVITRIKLTY